VTPKSQPFATFAVKAGDTVTADSRRSSTNPYAASSFSSSNTIKNLALSPFHKNDYGGFLNSWDVRSTAGFGYTYPELEGDTRNTTLNSRVNALYGPNAKPQKRGVESRATAGAPSYTHKREYIAAIKVPKFALRGSFSIYLFIGKEPSTDPEKWGGQESFVGVSGILAARSGRAEDSGVEVHGVVPLTAALEARWRDGRLETLKERSVEAYLKENLHWRIKGVSFIYRGMCDNNKTSYLHPVQEQN